MLDHVESQRPILDYSVCPSCCQHSGSDRLDRLARVYIALYSVATHVGPRM